MTSQDFEQVPVSAYGAARRAAWLAHHQANSDMADRAAVEAHGQSEDHRVVQAGQGGLFGHATPQDMGAAVAARTRRIGDDWGVGRDIVPPDLDAMGSTSIGPAPSRVDLRHVGMPPGHQVGESPLAAFMRAREQ